MNVSGISRYARASAEMLLPPILPEAEPGKPQAWELLETGRYMPRRIRGSFPGRELG